MLYLLLNLSFSVVASLTLSWKYYSLNKEKEELCSRLGIDESRKDEFKEMGDCSPLFRYARRSLTQVGSFPDTHTVSDSYVI